MTHFALSCRAAVPVRHTSVRPSQTLRSLAGLAAASTLLWSAAANAQCLRVEAPVDYFGAQAGNMCTADVDGDLDIDILLRTINGLEVLRNDGSGVFTLEPLYASVSLFGEIAAGDVNNDGHVDIVVGMAGVGVLLNQGDGTFGELAVYGDSESSSPKLIDLDGDGDLDVYTGGDRVSVWINEGGGVFAPEPAVYNPILAIDNADDVTAADLNGDGFPEIIGANGAAGINAGPAIQVFVNNGDGTFAAATALVPQRFGARSVTAGDFDGDGDQDIAFGMLGSSVRTMINSGDGTFAQGPTTSMSEVVNTVVAADLDHDKIADIAHIGGSGATQFGACLISRNLGNGAFITVGGTGGQVYFYDLVAADFNGDKLADVATLCNNFDLKKRQYWVSVMMSVMGGPRTDVTGDGVVNSTDVSEFINIWFADQSEGMMNADFNHDGVSNSTDVNAFINAWFLELGGGCD